MHYQSLPSRPAGLSRSKEYTIHINFRKDDITAFASLPDATTAAVDVATFSTIATTTAAAAATTAVGRLLLTSNAVVVGIGEGRIIVRGGKLLLTL